MADLGHRAGLPGVDRVAGLRRAAAGWMARRFGVTVDPDARSPPASGPRSSWPRRRGISRLRTPGRDTVLVPAVSYPTYAMGAALGRLPGRRRCRERPTAASTSPRSTPPTPRGRCAVGQHPVQPDRGARPTWRGGRVGRAHGVPVFSDECYAEFTWDGRRARSSSRASTGVVAVHSLSKRSNLAGVRVGFYAGDPELVGYLRRGPHARRAHGARPGAGRRRWPPSTTTPTSRSSAGATASGWTSSAARPGRRRLPEPPMPAGGFYSGCRYRPTVDGGGWAWPRRLAPTAGLLVSPGEFYGPARRRASSGWPWSSPWSGSSWWPSGWPAPALTAGS